MATYTPNLNLGKPEATDAFGNFRQLFNDNMDILDNGGGGGSGGHTIIDQSGNAMPSRTGLQFIGASVTDDSVNNKTVVTVTGGGGGVHYSTSEQVIGTWIDGKPIYQCTWSGTKTTNAEEVVISGLVTLDTLVDSKVIFKGNTGAQIAQYFRDASDFGRCWFDNNGIHMDLGNSYPIRPVTWYITLQYTKTTD